MVPNMRQAIIWTNDSLGLWRIYASLGLSDGRLTSHTAECRYNTIQYYMILLTSFQELSQNVNYTLDPQKTHHTSP